MRPLERGQARPGPFGNAVAELGDVMPIGDSLTFGGIYQGGWRKTFFETRTDLTSTGSMSESPNDSRWRQHEGHSGYMTSVMLGSSYFPKWIVGHPARNYIIHAGTANIVLGDTNSANYATDVVSMVDQILALRPTAKILVAKIIAFRSDAVPENAAVTAFRAAVTTALSGYSQVTMVNMTAIADVNYIDTAHVDATGYASMAADFLAAATTAGF